MKDPIDRFLVQEFKAEQALNEGFLITKKTDFLIEDNTQSPTDEKKPVSKIKKSSKKADKPRTIQIDYSASQNKKTVLNSIWNLWKAEPLFWIALYEEYKALNKRIQKQQQHIQLLQKENKNLKAIVEGIRGAHIEMDKILKKKK